MGGRTERASDDQGTCGGDGGDGGCGICMLSSSADDDRLDGSDIVELQLSFTQLRTKWKRAMPAKHRRQTCDATERRLLPRANNAWSVVDGHSFLYLLVS